jgi:hypothetical protein
MKWLRYQRVISLETQVGITSQSNKWANTDARIHRSWDQVPRRSNHPLSHPLGAKFHDHECGVIRCLSQCAKYSQTVDMKNIRQHIAQRKFVIINYMIIETARELAKCLHQTRL